MTCEEYLEDIRLLHGSAAVEVEHDPFSERYQRAQMYLDGFIYDCICIGFYEEIRSHETKYVEAVTWNGPVESRLSREDRGAYGVFKILYEKQIDGSHKPKFAELFAYYDGNPTRADKGNHCVDTLQDAIDLMESFNKYKTC